ncbi:iron complex outermembrane receptor protein [Sphingomonas kyeonggiensis]|uniref:Iron complex outermembrane receptor protein n=1 Tax=Sphingomonas kyeonggiensis TaxID=1268553 RepID=A0A7W7K2T4_9SPHN|nr:TonB-dependent receptor [Sphingomonas kyeonggiensis]MBB4839979.1 iron complex outermembrane receptor protein [Sphingomonas kyeonggiensis]
MRDVQRGTAICAAALLWSGQAWAQSTTTSAETGAGGGNGQAAGVEEIVVTAQRREQSLQDVPISVNVFSAATLDALGAQSAGDIDTFTPGLTIDDTSVTQPHYAIRGVSSDDFGIGTEPAVGVFIDGVYTGRSGSALIFFNDVDRVEVLKGPQGTLFGRNTSAGAISIITKKPVDAFEGNAQLRIGNYERRRAEGMLNVPLGDTLALRVNGVYNKRNGYLTDAVTGRDYEREDNWSGRAALRFRPGAGTDILLAYDHDNTHKDGPAAIGIGPLALSQDPEGPFANDTLGGSRESRLLDAFTLTIDQDLGDKLKLTSLSSYRWFKTLNREDEDGTNLAAHHLDTENNERNRSYYQELRLAQSTSRLTWVLGASYFHESAMQKTRTIALTDSIDTVLANVAGLPLFTVLDSVGLPVFGIPWVESIDNHADNDSYAAFGDLTWSATPKLNLTVGLRYTRDEKKFSWQVNPYSAPGLTQVGAPGALYNAILGASVFPDAATISVADFYNAVVGTNIIFEAGALNGTRFTRKESFSDVSPRFVIDYHFTPDVMAYASAARGYKAGGYNSVELNSFFKPETVWNFEGGLKSNLFERRLQFNLSAYHYVYRDRQQLSLESISGSGVPQYVTLSGDSRAWGIDLDTRFAIAPGISIGAVAGYIDSVWVSRTEQGVDIDGQPTGEPSFRGVLNAHLDRDLGGGAGGIFADASYSYTSKRRLNDAIRASDAALENSPIYGDMVDFSKLKRLRGSREIVNARIGWRLPGNAFSLSVFAENLFDVRTPRTLNPISAQTLGTPYVRMDRPRFWGVELNGRF